jgi:hypothetical protein
MYCYSPGHPKKRMNDHKKWLLHRTCTRTASVVPP